MKNDRRSHGLWEATAPPAPVTPPLQADQAVDVAIVGAGYTGLSAALHLAEGGARVAVLEAEEIGYGGSGRNVGLVNAGMWVMPAELSAVLGETYGARLLDILGNAPDLVFELIRRHAIDCQATRTGTLHCAVGRAGLKEITERARQWSALKAPVHLLDAEATRAKTGTDAYTGALLDLRAGTIQPLAYARGLARAAMKAGAAIHTASPVTAAHDRQSHWELGTQTGAVVRARWVIVASNAYSHQDGPWASLRTELVRLPYFNMATAPLTPALRERILPERQGAWDTRQVLSSFRYDDAGRLVFGSVGALSGAGLRIHTQWGRRALAQLYPALKDIPFEHEWYGTIGMTTDALPRLHRAARNTVSFSGYNGRGIAPGTVLGRELARLVLGAKTEDDLPLPVTPIQRAPWRRTRECCYEVGARLVHGMDAR
ncbi:NAD(P)/FAD-dependent oxidoreductase [Achromobacter aloeverae]|uniref:FAD-dependent oxidoreductase n=1 Tax=Achromobacter aloeverae TaxID=1750518 RepID=A0A4Q1HJL0_9BURK|nr:FAD-binding oxidoreductase [Achromobacter aloeverae]RXN86753.1 FAD-dependent oxidoreductase [Achromobacter aloeverae]